jgi:hypothetical protein
MNNAPTVHEPNVKCRDCNKGGSRNFIRGGGAHGERVEREPTGGLGAEFPVGSRGKAPGGGSGGRSPPEVDDIL